MTDRTDIACMIAEWWALQKAKKRKDEITTYEDFVKGNYISDVSLLDSTIIIEYFMKVESISPLKLEKDYSQITIRRPDGKRCIVQKFKEPEDESQKAGTSEISTPPVTMFQDNHCCNTCKYELYYMDGIDKELYGIEISFNRRDCISSDPEAQSFFKDKVKITLSKVEILPADHCPFWKQINGIKNKSNHYDNNTGRQKDMDIGG